VPVEAHFGTIRDAIIPFSGNFEIRCAAVFRQWYYFVMQSFLTTAQMPMFTMAMCCYARGRGSCESLTM